MKKYVCTVCGYIYDEAAGDPDNGVEPGTKWEDVPEGFRRRAFLHTYIQGNALL